MNESNMPAQVGSNDLLGLVDAVGMVNYLNHGAASHVSSEGCHGVTQEHLERFSELVRAAERQRWEPLVAELRHIAERCEFPDGDYVPVSLQMWAEDWIRRIEGPTRELSRRAAVRWNDGLAGARRLPANT